MLHHLLPGGDPRSAECTLLIILFIVSLLSYLHNCTAVLAVESNLITKSANTVHPATQTDAQSDPQLSRIHLSEVWTILLPFDVCVGD